MRNPILAIAIGFVVVAPCIALAKGKKDTIEVTQSSHQVTQPTSSTTGGGASSKTTKPVSSSTGPTKPTLPSSGGRHQ
jgi:hypothetical protein